MINIINRQAFENDRFLCKKEKRDLIDKIIVNVFFRLIPILIAVGVVIAAKYFEENPGTLPLWVQNNIWRFEIVLSILFTVLGIWFLCSYFFGKEKGEKDKRFLDTYKKIKRQNNVIKSFERAKEYIDGPADQEKRDMIEFMNWLEVAGFSLRKKNDGQATQNRRALTKKLYGDVNEEDFNREMGLLDGEKLSYRQMTMRYASKIN